MSQPASPGSLPRRALLRGGVALAAALPLSVGGGAVARASSPAAVGPAVAEPPDAQRVSGSAGTITPDEIERRAKYWIDQHVMYSQTSYHPDIDGTRSYRQDCSGYVSMAWRVDTSYTTLTITAVAHPISIGELQPGDALWRDSNGEGHISLFRGWTAGRGAAIVWQESAPGLPALQSEWAVSYISGGGYSALRYNGLRVVTPEMVRKAIRRHVPRLAPKVQPVDARTLVNLDTIYYSDAVPYDATLPMAGGTVDVQVHAEPVGFRWFYGDGTDRDSGADPGRPYPDQTVTHKYQHPGRHAARVDVTWGNYRYRLPGEPWQDLPGEDTIGGSATDVTVLDMSGLLVDSDPD